MDLKEKIGERIVQLRKARNLTQRKFALTADMERTYLNHIEKGRKNISVSTLERILITLDISIKDFFDSELFSTGKKQHQ